MDTLFNDLFSAATPVLLQAFSAILAAFLLWVANLARVRFGIEIEARHREAIHSALMSGIRAALSKGLTGQEAISAAIDHAARSTPDAILKLKPKDGVLEGIAQAKLREALGSHQR